MMDLDNFKGYNDRLGHPAGDALLHAVGAAIYGSARGEDRVFRYGGDEFAVMLPDVDARGGRGDRRARAPGGRAAHRQGSGAGDDHRRRGRHTRSDAVDKNDLIAAADIALYLGKQSGEDRVVRADEVPNEMRDLRSTLDRLARAALLHPDDAPTVDSLVEQAALLSHATEHGQDTVRGALLGVARSLDALDPARSATASASAGWPGWWPASWAATRERPTRSSSPRGCRAWKGSAPTSWSRSPRCARSARSCAGIAPAARWSERRWAPRCWPWRTPTTRWWRLPDGPHADRRAAIDELTAAAGQRYGPDVVRALAAVVGVKQRTSRSRRSGDEDDGSPRSGLIPRARCYDRASLCRATSPPPRARQHPVRPSRRSWWWWH